MNVYAIESEKALEELIGEIVENSLTKVLLRVLPTINNESKSQGEEKEFLNLKETQDMLGMYRDGVLKLIDSGDLPCFRSQDGRNYKIKRSDIQALTQLKNGDRRDIRKVKPKAEKRHW
jgi:hypothetical protein